MKYLAHHSIEHSLGSNAMIALMAILLVVVGAIIIFKLKEQK